MKIHWVPSEHTCPKFASQDVKPRSHVEGGGTLLHGTADLPNSGLREIKGRDDRVEKGEPNSGGGYRHT